MVDIGFGPFFVVGDQEGRRPHLPRNVVFPRGADSQIAHQRPFPLVQAEPRHFLQTGHELAFGIDCLCLLPGGDSIRLRTRLIDLTEIPFFELFVAC